MLLVYLTASWVLGIILARFLWAQGVIGCGSPPTWALAVSSALLVAAAILLRRRKRVRLALVLLLFALLGGWRYQSHPHAPCFTPDDLAFHNGEGEPAWVTVVKMSSAAVAIGCSGAISGLRATPNGPQRHRSHGRCARARTPSQSRRWRSGSLWSCQR